MTLKQVKRAVAAGEFVLDPACEVKASSDFQMRRLTAAVSAARIYLNGAIETQAMGTSLGVTPERAAQIVRLGVKYMLASGVLRPALSPEPTPEQTPSPS